MKYLYLFSLGLLSLHCGLIAKKMNGARKATIENESTIGKWLQHNQLPANDVVTIRPDSFGFYFNGSNMLFDRNTGKMVALGYNGGMFCPKDVDQMYATLLPYHLLRPQPQDYFIVFGETREEAKVTKFEDSVRIDLRTYIAGLTDFQGKGFSLDGAPACDYLLFIPFAKYYGARFQCRDIRKYYEAARSNKNAVIRVVLVNLDKQEWWGPEWDQKISLGF